MTLTLTDGWAVVATIDPDAYTATSYLSDEIDLKDYSQLVAIVMCGDLGSSATIDAAFHGSTTAGGSYAAISGKAITQLTQAGTDSDKQAIIRLDAADQTRRYVKLNVDVGTATSDMAAIVLGRSVYKPATNHDLASVDEVV